MSFLLALALLVHASPVVAQAGGGGEGPTRDVVFRFEAEDGTPLEAKLSLPRGAAGRVPVVFYLHGAGPRTYDNPFRYEDAEGVARTGKYLDFHAERLASEGIAFCRMSKRGCRAVAPPRWMEIEREVFAGAQWRAGLVTYAGLAFAPNGNLYASSVATGRIGEFDPEGRLVRTVLDPDDGWLFGWLPPFATAYR